MEHIHELEALGVAPPSRIPSVFVVAPELLSQEDTLKANRLETCGEVEFYLIPRPGATGRGGQRSHRPGSRGSRRR